MTRCLLVRKGFLTSVLFAFFIGFFSSQANATVGYFAHGYGTKYKGLGGAGVALYLNTLSAATNPAAMVLYGGGYDFSLSWFNPNREYTVTGIPSGFPGTFGLAPGTVESDANLFVIPALGANWVFGTDNSIGFSVYGNGGMNTDYDARTFGFNPAGVDLSQLFLALTYARKLTPQHAVGITPILSYQRFKAAGLRAFSPFSSDPTKLTNNNHDSSVGFGVKVGYLGEFMTNVSVGASFQTKIAMKEFDEYAGLFAQQGGFDIPSTWTVGVAVTPVPSLTLAADVQQILYSGIKSINNPLLPNLQTARLGDDGGAGFGWEDMTVVKVGLQWESGGNWTWRAGFATGEQPIPDSEVLFNILAPGVVEQHLTFGFTKSLASGLGISVAIMRASSSTVSGPNPLEAPDQQSIELKMDQWDFEVGFSF